jgi:hypothetical protein
MITTKQVTKLYRDHGLDARNIADKSDVAQEMKVEVTRILYHEHGLNSSDIAAFERHMFGATTRHSTISYRLGLLARNKEKP